MNVPTIGREVSECVKSRVLAAIDPAEGGLQPRRHLGWLAARTTASNRWLGTTRHLGNLYEVSRKVAAWIRDPEPGVARKLTWTTNPKA